MAPPKTVHPTADQGPQREAGLVLLNETARAALAGRPFVEVVRDAVSELARLLPRRRVTYGILRTEPGELRITCSDGPGSSSARAGLVLPLGAPSPAPLGTHPVAEPVIIEDVTAEPRLAALRETLPAHGIRALVAASVHQCERVLGWLWLDSPAPGPFRPSEVLALHEVAELLSLAAADEETRRERRRADEERRRSEEVYRTLVETSPDAILLLDLHGNIILCNRQAARMYDPQTLTGLEGRSALELLAPDDRLRAAANLARASTRGSQRGIGYTLVRKDGSTFPAEVSTAVIADAGGRAEGLLIIARDIHEQRHHEERQAELQTALRKAALEWRRTFDSIESPVLMLDLEGNVVRLNRAAQTLAGRSFQELVRRPLAELGAGQPWRATGELQARIAAERTSVALHVSDPTTGRSWDLTGSLTGGQEGGVPERIIVVARDITATVALQVSLRRSETMSALGALVAGVAHEVRNPLHGITATLDAFEARFGQREDFGRYLRVLRGELDRLTLLMEDLLAYGRPSEAALAPTPLGEVVTAALRSCGPLARRQKVRLESLLTENLPPLPMDRARVLAALRNLVENAILHAPPGTVVVVAAREVPHGGRPTVECSVTDEGPGFRDADLPRVFDPFFTRRRGGTGLGLSIVQRVAELHGGAVRAGNRAEGGAVVTLALPRSG